MSVVLLVLALTLAAAAAIPGRRRPLARVLLVWAVGASPILVAAWAISRFEGAVVGSYLALVPVIVTWCCILDARYGLSHRLARVGPRAPTPPQRASE